MGLSVLLEHVKRAANLPRFTCIHFCGTRSDEEADGRLRSVLGDDLAAEGGEDRHGYQTQGGRRTFLIRSSD